MDEISNEKIKEALNNYRLTRNLLWNTIIITIGGIIGLIFRITGGKSDFIEITLLLTGFITLFFLIKFIAETNYRINKYWSQLK